MNLPGDDRGDINQLRCVTCYSSDRNFHLLDTKVGYLKRLCPELSNRLTETSMVCWECKSFIRRMELFYHKAMTTHRWMEQGSDGTAKMTKNHTGLTNLKSTDPIKVSIEPYNSNIKPESELGNEQMLTETPIEQKRLQYATVYSDVNKTGLHGDAVHSLHGEVDMSQSLQSEVGLTQLTGFNSENVVHVSDSMKMDDVDLSSVVERCADEQERKPVIETVDPPVLQPPKKRKNIIQTSYEHSNKQFGIATTSKPNDTFGIPTTSARELREMCALKHSRPTVLTETKTVLKETIKSPSNSVKEQPKPSTKPWQVNSPEFQKPKNKIDVEPSCSQQKDEVREALNTMRDVTLQIKDDYLLQLLLSKPKPMTLKNVQERMEIEKDIEIETQKDLYRIPYTPSKIKDLCRVISLNESEMLAFRDKLLNKRGFKRRQYKCEKCIEYFQNGMNLVLHNSKHELSYGSFGCNICGLRFQDEHACTKHEKEHYMLLECFKCDYRHHNRERMSDHVNTTHRRKEKTCRFCQKKFSLYREYTRHLGRVHHKRCYTCDHCGATFTQKRYLIRHISKHMEKTEQCSICNQKIKKTELYEHVIAYHQNKAEPNRTPNPPPSERPTCDRDNNSAREIDAQHTT